MAGKSRGLPCGSRCRSTWRGNLLPSVVAMTKMPCYTVAVWLFKWCWRDKRTHTPAFCAFSAAKTCTVHVLIELEISRPTMFLIFFDFPFKPAWRPAFRTFFCHHALLQGGWLRQPVMCKGCWRGAVRLWKHCCHFFSNCRFQRAGLRRWNVLHRLYIGSQNWVPQYSDCIWFVLLVWIGLPSATIIAVPQLIWTVNLWSRGPMPSRWWRLGIPMHLGSGVQRGAVEDATGDWPWTTTAPARNAQCEDVHHDSKCLKHVETWPVRCG